MSLVGYCEAYTQWLDRATASYPSFLVLLLDCERGADGVDEAVMMGLRVGGGGGVGFANVYGASIYLLYQSYGIGSMSTRIVSLSFCAGWARGLVAGSCAHCQCLLGAARMGRRCFESGVLVLGGTFTGDI